MRVRGFDGICLRVLCMAFKWRFMDILTGERDRAVPSRTFNRLRVACRGVEPDATGRGPGVHVRYLNETICPAHAPKQNARIMIVNWSNMV